MGYGDRVTMEESTNQVTVNVTQKGYAAGVAAYAGTGSTIKGCTNQGNISGVGGYLGGIVGTAKGVTITNCMNDGSIIDSMLSATYPYCVGGIAGSATSASRITNCGNAGAVTSHLKNTGGVVGYFAGTAEKCFNSGNVTGIYATGGIRKHFFGEYQRDRLLQPREIFCATRRRLRSAIPVRRASAALSAIQIKPAARTARLRTATMPVQPQMRMRRRLTLRSAA